MFRIHPNPNNTATLDKSFLHQLTARRRHFMALPRATTTRHQLSETSRVVSPELTLPDELKAALS